jgi:hypothetical protein
LEHGGTDCKRPCAAVALVLEERGWLRYLDAVEKRTRITEGIPTARVGLCSST